MRNYICALLQLWALWAPVVSGVGGALTHGVCLWAEICPPTPRLQPFGYYMRRQLCDPSTRFIQLRWRCCWYLFKCFLSVALRRGNTSFFFFKICLTRQTSTCLGHSLSRSIFPIRSHTTGRANWRAKLVSFFSDSLDLMSVIRFVMLSKS